MKTEVSECVTEVWEYISFTYQTPWTKIVEKK